GLPPTARPIAAAWQEGRRVAWWRDESPSRVPAAAATPSGTDLLQLRVSLRGGPGRNLRQHRVEDIEEPTALLLAQLADPMRVFTDRLAHHGTLGLGQTSRCPPERRHGLVVEGEGHLDHTDAILPYSSGPRRQPGSPPVDGDRPGPTRAPSPPVVEGEGETPLTDQSAWRRRNAGTSRSSSIGASPSPRTSARRRRH